MGKGFLDIRVVKHTAVRDLVGMDSQAQSAKLQSYKCMGQVGMVPRCADSLG